MGWFNHDKGKEREKGSGVGVRLGWAGLVGVRTARGRRWGPVERHMCDPATEQGELAS